jgi:RHS repeat-associated protein
MSRVLGSTGAYGRACGGRFVKNHWYQGRKCKVGIDGNGNLLKKGDTTYTWDARDRLVSTSGAGGGTYGYDTSNLRTKMGEQKVLLDGIEEAREYGASDVRYDHDPSRVDGLLAQKAGGVKGYFVTDALGSVYAVVDASGAVVSKYGYDVYGARTATTEGMATGWGFTGRRHDTGTEMYYRERYRETTYGGWMSPDPIYELLLQAVDTPAVGRQLTSRYLYASSTPINGADPTGLLFGFEMVPDVFLDLLQAQVLYPITTWFESRAALSMGYECPPCRNGFIAGVALVRELLTYRIPLAVTGRDPGGKQWNPWDPGHIAQLSMKLTALLGVGGEMTAFCIFPAAKQLGLWYISIGALDAVKVIGRMAPPWYPRLPN